MSSFLLDRRGFPAAGVLLFSWCSRVARYLLFVFLILVRLSDCSPVFTLIILN